MEKKPVKINLSTAILVIVIILLLALISFLIFRNNELKDKARNIAETSNVLNEKIDTSENNIKVEEKNDITKKNSKLEENDELKNFLSYAGFLNEYNDNEYKDESKNKEEVLTNDKIMISSMYTRLKRKNGYVTYDLKQIKEAAKEIFNEDINVEKFIKAKKGTIFYDSKIGAYIDGGGDATYSVYFVKLESQSVSNGVYEVTFLYSYVGEYDLVEGTVGERDCYRTTIKIKVNDNYKYSKYQLVSSNMSGQKVGKVKDYATNNTKNHNMTK